MLPQILLLDEVTVDLDVLGEQQQGRCMLIMVPRSEAYFWATAAC